MSIVAYILLTSFWVIAIWALSVVSVKLFSPLASWPEYWLAIISIAFGAPIFAYGLLGIGIVPPTTFTVVPGFFDAKVFGGKQADATIISAFKHFLWAVYIFGCSYHLIRLVVGWAWLVRAANNGRLDIHLDNTIIVTKNNVPLCAFGAFHPVILCPENIFHGAPMDIDLKIRDLLIAHEAAHIRNRDPLFMLGLLFMRVIVWPHPAIHDLFKRWQFAAEIRADNHALHGESLETRKKYGQKLVNILRRSGVKNSKGTLPCPSATLNLSNYRSAKMRVENILNQNPKPYKAKRLKFQLSALTVGITIFGAGSLAAVASPKVSSDRDAQPSVRVPPIFPASCVANKGKYAASVVVKFDVDKRGTVENVRVTKTDNACFNQATITSVSKWGYEPVMQNGRPRKRKGVQAMVKYISAED